MEPVQIFGLQTLLSLLGFALLANWYFSTAPGDLAIKGSIETSYYTS